MQRLTVVSASVLTTVPLPHLASIESFTVCFGLIICVLTYMVIFTPRA